MDINDIVAWMVYVVFLQLNGLLEPAAEGVRLAFVGDAIRGASYG